ncbi:MAG: phosphonate C-P lyase system protein PhnH [Alphaproteobacteria bacterium]|nr:phosphonate C-P lyase system protein PhnH [Alphaproteobacteria bacterium]
MAPALAVGFADPVFDSQMAFRTLLAALSRPGLIQTLPLWPDAPAPLGAASAAALLALADNDTPVWLGRAAASEEVIAFLRFHCGCPIVEEPGRAAFALITAPLEMPALAAFNAGSETYPDRSATLIVQVDELRNDAGWTLKGPGIDGAVRLSAGALPPTYIAELKANHARYPQGIDSILTSGQRLAGLPRSTKIGN